MGYKTHKIFKRGLYKKKLAPKGTTFVVVEITDEKNRKTYTNRMLVPVDITEEEMNLAEFRLINALNKKFEGLNYKPS